MNDIIVCIIEAVSKEYNLTKEILISRQKDEKVTEARNIAIYLCRKKTDCSAIEIGECFGNSDHTTIVHAEKSVQQKMESDFEFTKNVKRIDEAIG